MKIIITLSKQSKKQLNKFSKMNASELRIGNYVKYISKAECSMAIEAYDLWRMWTDKEFSDKITRIPLTKEWLLKFGFAHDKVSIALWKEAWSPGHPSQRFDMYWNNSHGLVMSSRYQEYSDHLTMNHIQYVHQLQNLYFALTGEELTIKPNSHE